MQTQCNILHRVRLKAESEAMHDNERPILGSGVDTNKTAHVRAIISPCRGDLPPPPPYLHLTDARMYRDVGIILVII